MDALFDTTCTAPNRATAAAMPASPAGCASRAMAVGATYSGVPTAMPSSVVAVSHRVQSTITRGRSNTCANAAPFSRFDTRSSAAE